MGADHAGFPLKEELKGFLEMEGHQVLDVGTDSTAAVDYPAFCAFWWFDFVFIAIASHVPQYVS